LHDYILFLNVSVLSGKVIGNVELKVEYWPILKYGLTQSVNCRHSVCISVVISSRTLLYYTLFIITQPYVNLGILTCYVAFEVLPA
jgi:hypothetical protein